MSSSDSEFGINFLEHDALDTASLIETMSDIVKVYLYDNEIHEKDYEYDVFDITILVNGKEIEKYSPNLILRTDVMNLAQKKANLMFIKYKNEKIRRQQAKDYEAELKATESRKSDYEKLKTEFEK